MEMVNVQMFQLRVITKMDVAQQVERCDFIKHYITEPMQTYDHC